MVDMPLIQASLDPYRPAGKSWIVVESEEKITSSDFVKKTPRLWKRGECVNCSRDDFLSELITFFLLS